MAGGAIAIDVELTLNAGTDTRAPGGEVTVALCGHWEHDGACRWPHHSAIDSDSEPARLRTVVVVPDDERGEVEQRVETALRADPRWRVVRFTPGAIRDDENALAARLTRAHRADDV